MLLNVINNSLLFNLPNSSISKQQISSSAWDNLRVSHFLCKMFQLGISFFYVKFFSRCVVFEVPAFQLGKQHCCHQKLTVKFWAIGVNSLCDDRKGKETTAGMITSINIMGTQFQYSKNYLRFAPSSTIFFGLSTP